MIKVSVLIPIYNEEKYLEECLSSVVHQSLDDIEIICVNDGSTDGSLAIIQGFAANDNRIKVVDKQNSGYGHSVNIGIEMARGTYIAIVESDDFVNCNMLEELYNVAECYQADVVKTDSRSFTGLSKDYHFTYRNVLPSPNHQLYGKVTSSKEDMRVFDGYVYTWAGLYRRDFLNKNNIRHHESPGASYQDNGFWFQTTMYADRIYFHNKAYYNLRRDNPNSSIHSKGKVFCICDEYDFIDEKIKNSGLDITKEYLQTSFRWRLKNYISMFDRIAPEYTQMYWDRIQSDIDLAGKNGNVNPGLFSNKEWNYIHTILNNTRPLHIDYVCVPESIRKKIENSNRIILYGAGKVAERVYACLQLGGQCHRISAVVVSKKEVDTFNNLPILEFNYYEWEEKDLIIVAVGNRYRYEIEKKLVEIGYNRFIDANCLLI